MARKGDLESAARKGDLEGRLGKWGLGRETCRCG